jgi:uncharacterized protein (DUF1499 family)
MRIYALCILLVTSCVLLHAWTDIFRASPKIQLGLLGKIASAFAAFDIASNAGLLSFNAAWATDQSVVQSIDYGIKDGRLLKCRVKSNCVSTSSINSVDKYSAPWEFPSSSEDEFQAIINAVQSDPYLNLIEADGGKLYVHAEAKSAFPPNGIDDLEFLINPRDKLITYRSNSRTLVSAGTEIVGDGGSNKNRLLSMQRRLGVQQMGMNDDLQQLLKSNDKRNFLDRLRIASQPNEINFIDNSVPDSP